MIFTQSNLNGTVTVSAIIDGVWVRRIYIGYNENEARAQFKIATKPQKPAKRIAGRRIV